MVSLRAVVAVAAAWPVAASLVQLAPDGSAIEERIFAVSPAEADSPTFAQGYFLDAAAEKLGARCLDGSSPLQYHRRGTGDGVDKWFIWQEGGAWCTDDASCAARALGSLGSTRQDPQNTSLTGGYFDIDSSVNPLMYNWNAVSLRYCDGGSLMGDVTEPVKYKNQTLYLRGQRIFQAQVQALLHERGMSNATDVVFGGCSAGGLAVYLNCDKFASLVAAATNGRAKIACMPDSGFFIDEISRVHVRLMRAFETHNATATVNQECLAKYNSSGEPWRCFFAQWVAPYISTPTFALQSQYDGWQMGGLDAPSTNTFGLDMRALLRARLLASPQHGAFLDSCSHHCGSQGPKPAWGSKGTPGSLVGGVSMGEAVQRWYSEGSSALPNSGFYEQNQTFPCDGCCHGTHDVAGCPAAFPWAYRPAADFDFCCATADDNAGNIGINARVNRSRRSNSCKDNNYIYCSKKPCDDYVNPSRCDAAHPWAYRPAAEFDFCCATADDNHGHVGINGLANRSARASTCKDNNATRCGQKPCADYPLEPLVV